jgi:hypothetical protein
LKGLLFREVEPLYRRPSKLAPMRALVHGEALPQSG